MIIGLSGKLGVGKDYIAQNILNSLLPHNTLPIFLSFADHLKVELYCRDNNNKLNYNNLFINKTADIRKELQTYGTELNRNNKSTIWIDALDMWIQLLKNRHKNYNFIFIITDVRFKNEFKYIKSNNGIIIRINANKRNEERLMKEASGNLNIYNSIKNHISEIELDNYDFDFIIDNDKELDLNSIGKFISKYFI